MGAQGHDYCSSKSKGRCRQNNHVPGIGCRTGSEGVQGSGDWPRSAGKFFYGLRGRELSQTGKEHRLKEAVAPVASDYDFIVIDTPPSLGVLTVNAFICATDILIPTTAGIFATAGISQLNETVTSVQKYCNPAVKVRGILFTRFNPRANISRQMKELAEQLGKYISAPIYKKYIRSAVVVEEAQSNSQDIFDYANKSTVAENYKAFIDEFLKGVNE